MLLWFWYWNLGMEGGKKEREDGTMVIEPGENLSVPITVNSEPIGGRESVENPLRESSIGGKKEREDGCKRIRVHNKVIWPDSASVPIHLQLGHKGFDRFALDI